jgi:hypothetical protein
MVKHVTLARPVGATQAQREAIEQGSSIASSPLLPSEMDKGA